MTNTAVIKDICDRAWKVACGLPEASYTIYGDTPWADKSKFISKDSLLVSTKKKAGGGPKVQHPPW
jgi:hypothetical protein